MLRNQANAAIDFLGGPTVVAALCGVTPQAVSQWRSAGIPRGWLKYLNAVRPDAFAELIGTEGAPSVPEHQPRELMPSDPDTQGVCSAN